MSRQIKITGYKLDKEGCRLVPDYRHLPVNIQLQKRSSKRIRLAKSRAMNLPAGG